MSLGMPADNQKTNSGSKLATCNNTSGQVRQDQILQVELPLHHRMPDDLDLHHGVLHIILFCKAVNAMALTPQVDAGTLQQLLWAEICSLLAVLSCYSSAVVDGVLRSEHSQ